MRWWSACWWVFLSRAPRSERWSAIVLMVFALAGAYALNHESMGQLWLISWALPVRESRLRGLGCGRRSAPREVSAHIHGLGHRARLWSVDAPAQRGHYRRRGNAILVEVVGDLPRSGSWLRTATSRQRSLWPRQQSRPEPSGPAFGGLIATASSQAHGSRLIGRGRRRPSFGDDRSVRAGRRSRSVAIASTPRSSAATTRSFPATTRPPAIRCGGTAMRPGSGSRRRASGRAPHRPSVETASTPSARPES